MGIPIPQKKIIKKNYSVLSSRTLSSTLQNQPESGKYGSTMMHTPYGDIKVLVGPDYKAPKPVEPEQSKTTMDYSKDNFNQGNMESSEPESDDEILAEDYQDNAAAEDSPKMSSRDGLLSARGDKTYDNLMAVAPQEIILNMYPLAPPKFTGSAKPKLMVRKSNVQQQQQQQQLPSNINYGPNALYYQALPLNSPVAAQPTPYNYPTNYPYANLPFQAPSPPMYFGY